MSERFAGLLGRLNASVLSAVFAVVGLLALLAALPASVALAWNAGLARFGVPTLDYGGALGLLWLGFLLAAWVVAIGSLLKDLGE